MRIRLRRDPRCESWPWASILSTSSTWHRRILSSIQSFLWIWDSWPSKNIDVWAMLPKGFNVCDVVKKIIFVQFGIWSLVINWWIDHTFLTGRDKNSFTYVTIYYYIIAVFSTRLKIKWYQDRHRMHIPVVPENNSLFNLLLTFVISSSDYWGFQWKIYISDPYIPPMDPHPLPSRWFPPTAKCRWMGASGNKLVFDLLMVWLCIQWWYGVAILMLLIGCMARRSRFGGGMGTTKKHKIIIQEKIITRYSKMYGRTGAGLHMKFPARAPPFASPYLFVIACFTLLYSFYENINALYYDKILSEIQTVGYCT